MQCDMQAVTDEQGRLHLRLGVDGQEWLHYIWRGQSVWLCSAAGRRRLSIRTALKLMLREALLRDAVGSLSGAGRIASSHKLERQA